MSDNKEDNKPIAINGWYTAGEAAKVIAANSQRAIKPAYLRSLARIGKVDTKKIGDKITLYKKADVDAYRVEDRGVKVARIQRARFPKLKKAEGA